MITLYDFEEMQAEKASITDFLETLREAQSDPEHITIDIVTVAENTNYSFILNGVKADDINYISNTGCVVVGNWKDNFELTVPETKAILLKVDTSNDSITAHYSFWNNGLSVNFLFNYDESYNQTF